MSRPPNTASNRQNRMAQMTMQEEIIEKKKREILEKLKSTQEFSTLRTRSSSSSAPTEAVEATSTAAAPVTEQVLAVVDPRAVFRNNFNNDGSFLENFKKLTQAASFIEQTNSMDNATGDLGSETSSIKETGKVLVSDKNCVQACDKPAASLENGLKLNAETATSNSNPVCVNGDASNRSTTLWASQIRTLNNTQLQQQQQQEEEDENTEDSDAEFRRVAKERNLKNMKSRLVCQYNNVDSDSSSSDQADQPKYEGSRYNQSNFPEYSNKRKEIDSDSSAVKIRKKSRWGDKVTTPVAAVTIAAAAAAPIPAAAATTSAVTAVAVPVITNSVVVGTDKSLKTVDRKIPAMMKIAQDCYGTADLSDEKWLAVEERYLKLLCEEMVRKRKHMERMAEKGKFKYDYDSDEDVEGGTWEHKLRKAEMEATKAYSEASSAVNHSRHHIGDFLPPEELKRFMDQYDKKKRNEPQTDYQENKLTEENKGFQMLQKLGWKEGEGLGASGSGIVEPINKTNQRESNQGLGVNEVAVPDENDNEYDAYRKRMMLAYRFRPNPLNNPRRAYY